MSYVVSMSLPFPPPKVKLLRGRRERRGLEMRGLVNQVKFFGLAGALATV